MRRRAQTLVFVTCFLMLGALAEFALAEVASHEPAATVASEPETAPPAGETAATEPAPGATAGAPAPRAATALSLGLSRTSIVWGSSVTATGTATGAVAGEPLTIERQTSATTWTAVATTTTAADGTYSVTITPSATWTLRARMDDDSATSAAVTLRVRPKITITRLSRAPIFVGAPLRATVRPAWYTGRITFRVRYAGRYRARVRLRARSGRVTGRIPTHGLGRLPVVASLPAANGLSANTQSFAVRSTWRTLRQGRRGADVAGLVRRAKVLRFHTPRVTTRFDHRVGDVVLAFHKARRMSRTKTVDRATWHALAVAGPMRPRYAGPARHIEVDKRRQIMMVVRNGRVIGTLHVSTGATGNTPEGRWRIYQMGGSYLYRFMAFVGNFGIHGYVPVPAYPASHGCVREPMWAAAWTYSRTRMGDRVYVY